MRIPPSKLGEQGDFPRELFFQAQVTVVNTECFGCLEEGPLPRSDSWMWRKWQ